MSTTPGRGRPHGPVPGQPPSSLDELIREQRRLEQRVRRREIPTAVAMIAFGVTGIIFGREEPLAVFVGSWITGAALWFLAGRSLRNRQEQGTGRRGQIATRTLGRQAATVLHQHPARERVAAGFIAYVGVLFVGGGLLTQRPLTPASVAGVLLVGAPFAAAGLRRLIRAARDGVWLTPSLLVVRDHGTTYRTAWDDVAAVSEAAGPTSLVVVLPRSMAALSVTGRDRGSRRGRALGDIPIRTGALAVDAPTLVDIIWHCHDPANRPELGTAGAVGTVRRIAEEHNLPHR
ncbi:hypothetical protein [Cellulomonas soli]|uniref:Uncharacterized protein n=1 Tax=Cellulomonas soli TaxID=931535 RepID=A0A512PF56_9CELL|nr:hypothetical protein [Cellulomonas soli]NYI59393.1 hypothetical protein [Cellulomonas soli]GEP69816.1 hypothetical protein CSO01_25310 [Cellulomonas soli]